MSRLALDILAIGGPVSAAAWAALWAMDRAWRGDRVGNLVKVDRPASAYSNLDEANLAALQEGRPIQYPWLVREATSYPPAPAEDPFKMFCVRNGSVAINVRIDRGPEAILDAAGEARRRAPDAGWRFVAGPGVRGKLLVYKDANARYLFGIEDFGPAAGMFGFPIRFTDDPAMAGRLVLEVE